MVGCKRARPTHELIEHSFNGTVERLARGTTPRKQKDRYRSGKSRVYDTLYRSTSDKWRLDGDAVMWRFVAQTVAREGSTGPRQCQEAWPRSGSSW